MLRQSLMTGHCEQTPVNQTLMTAVINDRPKLDELISVKQSSMTASYIDSWWIGICQSIINDGWTLGELTSVLWVKEEHVPAVEGRLGQVEPGLCCQMSPMEDKKKYDVIHHVVQGSFLFWAFEIPWLSMTFSMTFQSFPWPKFNHFSWKF